MKNLESQILELKSKGLSHNDISKDLGCSKSTVSNYCSKNGLFYDIKISIPLEIMEKIQEDYDNGDSIRNLSRLYGYSRNVLSKRIKNKRTIKKQDPEQRKKDIVKNVIYWRQRKKIELINYKGGECLECGYKKSRRALEFHHLDPNEKDFSISSSTKSFKKIKKEVDKCILVCSNCHCEIHDGLLDIKKLIKKEKIRKQNKK